MTSPPPAFDSGSENGGACRNARHVSKDPNRRRGLPASSVSFWFATPSTNSLCTGTATWFSAWPLIKVQAAYSEALETVSYSSRESFFSRQGTPPRSATTTASSFVSFTSSSSFRFTETRSTITALACSSAKSATRRWLTNSLGKSGSPNASLAHGASGGANHAASTFFSRNVREPRYVYPCFSKTRATARVPPSTQSKDRNARWSQTRDGGVVNCTPPSSSGTPPDSGNNASTALFARGFRARYGWTYASIWE